MAEVVFQNVGKIYPPDIRAVEDFNLEIQDGEFIVLVGPSGCGKSTTLRMVAGLEEISSGTISIGGRVVNDIQPKDRDIAMVFQNYALYPHMTVRENMAFGLKLRKFPKDEIESRIASAAAMLGIAELLDRRPKALSGGQRQRVAVGRAIVRQPAAFLFDEPLSNLDAKLRVQMRVEISRLHSELNTTMIFVTHDQVEAMTMGDRIVVMDGGCIQQCADPVTLYDKPANRFVAGFIGMPPMNFLEGRISSENGALTFVADTGASLPVAPAHHDMLSSYDGKKISFGIRPEDIGSTLAEAATDAPRLPATVDVIEPMGAETYLYVSAGSDRLTCRVDAHRAFTVGDRVEPAILIDKAHYFDPASGTRIGE